MAVSYPTLYPGQNSTAMKLKLGELCGKFWPGPGQGRILEQEPRPTTDMTRFDKNLRLFPVANGKSYTLERLPEVTGTTIVGVNQ